jgi:hypothetical protein
LTYIIQSNSKNYIIHSINYRIVKHQRMVNDKLNCQERVCNDQSRILVKLDVEIKLLLCHSQQPYNKERNIVYRSGLECNYHSGECTNHDQNYIF